MTVHEMCHSLLKDLEKLGFPIENVDIRFRPYSTTYYGRYFPKTDRIYIYPFKCVGELFDYSVVLKTAIHEFVHYMQYKDPNYKRVKGVMHDSAFWEMYNSYISQAEKYKMLERNNAEVL